MYVCHRVYDTRDVVYTNDKVIWHFCQKRKKQTDEHTGLGAIHTIRYHIVWTSLPPQLSRALPDITSGLTGNPNIFLPGQRTFNTFKNRKKNVMWKYSLNAFKWHKALYSPFYHHFCSFFRQLHKYLSQN